MNSIFNFKNGISFVAVALMLLAGCTFYDNYDIDLMPNATANNDDDAKSSSSKEKDTLYVINVGGSSDSKSSSSGVPTWTCGDSVMVRGGVEYETVEIGGVCITKKNLNYKPTGKAKSLCYDNLEENCEKYGRLYNYDAAKDACPEGWRLLTEDDLQRFLTSAGGDPDQAGTHFKVAGAWQGDAKDGDDEIEFGALPGGYCEEDEDYDSGYYCDLEGSWGQWWTSTDIQKNVTKTTMVLTGDVNGVNVSSALEVEQFAYVRCAWKK